MTQEEIEGLHEIVEGKISGKDNVLKIFRQRFPGCSAVRDDVVRELKNYYCKRLGQPYYSRAKLSAFQIFDAGGTVEDVVSQGIAIEKTAEEYLEDYFRVCETTEKDVKSTVRKRFEFPGGAVFGEGTAHDTIWRKL